MSNENVYSAAQVAQYLDHIGLPQSFHPSAGPKLDIHYLTTLFTHQITTVPYENLQIHYSQTHTVDLDPQVLFTKIVTNNRGRGGYCMETALFFKHILHALGFADAYTAGVRIRLRGPDGVPAGPYIGFVHLVIILTLEHDGTRYALDVAFGGDGPTKPLPLIEDLVHHNGLGTQEIRLTRGFQPDQTYRGPGASRKWIYQYRNRPQQEWNSFYAFDPDFEFGEPDFAVMSHFASTSALSMQSFTPLAIRFLRGTTTGQEEENENDGERTEKWEKKVRVVGKVMMVNGLVKRNMGGKTELVRTCVTEAERVAALREYFGILLTDEEVAGIKGRVPELGRA
ncbi:arylamine N-acetyltransferase, pineal gland isozyme NAT-10 [Echria macrotheca]|uniref:Arylamine N-acetyltransferase, pineal gland isozyme NAT-10 n=1 Tax=Echria macrotheca TaxID=438768 RepID=A0AAJ0BGI9_9PEZI|nr:arylamine N-acetyltransferase, pineal gland isozyme NAT-10 [Echria macrotheca]